jgi:hypothetical protein
LEGSVPKYNNGEVFAAPNQRREQKVQFQKSPLASKRRKKEKKEKKNPRPPSEEGMNDDL